MHDRLEETTEPPLFCPLKLLSRLQMMAAADAIVKTPEKQEYVEQGKVVAGQILMLEIGCLFPKWYNSNL